ncbi:MAG: hypothetical protein WBF39_08515 [Planococcus donghaensis]
MATIQDVQHCLTHKRDHLTARRWAKNRRIQQRILEKHFEWNEKLLQFNRVDQLRPLKANIDHYLDNPWLIDDQFNPPV